MAEGAAIALLASAFMAGGGSRGLGDLAVHLVALAVLPLAIHRAGRNGLHPVAKAFVWWFVAACGLLIVQLIPLPASLWARLPLRAALLDDLATAGVATTWLPMTLDPWGTVRGLLWLLTGVATWLLVLGLSDESRVRWFKCAVFLGVGMALLGFVQAAAGRQPTVRFHAFHNEFGATGTFANRNHFAMLMAMLAPLAIGLGRAGQASGGRGALAWYFMATLLVLAAALSFSRAGFLLATLGAAVVGGWAMLWRGPQRHGANRSRHALSLAVAGLLAAAGVASYAWSQVAARLEQDPLADLRFKYLEYGMQAVQAYLPWGSGIGSFRQAYAPFEPLHGMGDSFALHAHSELVEVALEAGWPGLALVAALLVLLGMAVWKARGGGHECRPSVFVMSITILLPLVHSAADYPLRTLAILVLFAGAVAHVVAHGRGQTATRRIDGFDGPVA